MGKDPSNYPPQWKKGGREKDDMSWLQKWLLGDIRQKVNEILEIVQDLQRKETRTMATLLEVQAEVAATKGAEDSALILINAILAKLTALGDAPTPEQLQALIDDLKASREPLAAAVAANPV